MSTESNIKVTFDLNVLFQSADEVNRLEKSNAPNRSKQPWMLRENKVIKVMLKPIHTCANPCKRLQWQSTITRLTVQFTFNSSVWTGDQSEEFANACLYDAEYFLVQVRLMTKVLCTPITTHPGFELMTSRSW